MKNENGVTLISLIIYVILITLVVAGVSAITASLYGNVNMYKEDTKAEVAFEKFNMYFLNDIKKENARITEAVSNGNSVMISYNGGSTTYTFKDGAIYKDNTKICTGVKSMGFTTALKTSTTPATVTVNLDIENYKTETTYVIEPKFVIE